MCFLLQLWPKQAAQTNPSNIVRALVVALAKAGGTKVKAMLVHALYVTLASTGGALARTDAKPTKCKGG